MRRWLSSLLVLSLGTPPFTLAAPASPRFQSAGLFTSQALGQRQIAGFAPKSAPTFVLRREADVWGKPESAVDEIVRILALRRPLLIQLYSRFHDLQAEQVRFFRSEVYKLTAGHFQVWGLASILDGRVTPYFEGEYVKALQAVFPDAELDPHGFHAEWSTPDLGKESIRFALRQTIMGRDILDRYDRRGSLSSRQLEQLRDDIYEINSNHFIAWGLHGALDRRWAPYFEGSYINALQAVFDGLGLDRRGFILEYPDADAAVDVFRFILDREMPRLMEDYRNLGAMDAPEMDRLRFEISEIRYAHLETWQIANLLNKRKGFFRNYRELVAKAFDDPRLGITADNIAAHRRATFKKKYQWKAGVDRGVANVREALDHYRPGLVEEYDALDRADPVAVDRFREKIYKIRKGDFNVWGIGAADNRKSAEYFGGSYTGALQVVFKDVELNPLGFHLDWDETRAAQSIRYRLSMPEHYPELLHHYDRLDPGDSAQINLLREQVYTFTRAVLAVMGLGALTNERTTPYYHGKYVEGLQAVFPLLHLNPLGFFLDWENPDRAVESIRFMLQREAPGLVERYDALDSFTGEAADALRGEITQLSTAHFIVWSLQGALDRDLAPYFHGSYIEALQAVFKKLLIPRAEFIANQQRWERMAG